MRLAQAVIAAALAMALGSCGEPQHPASTVPAPPAPPATPPPRPPPPSQAARPAPISAETFCFKLAQLTDKCPELAQAKLDQASCVEQARSGLADASSNPGIAHFVGCVASEDSCAGFSQCVTSGPSADVTSQLRECTDHSDSAALSAVGIPKADWARRRGANVTTFRDAQSTKQAPIEMCGVDAANRWLTTLTCDDGSRPLHDNADAEATRHGNVGPGGRCGSIIDHYVAPCPGSHYDIYIDAYICAR